MDKLSERLSDVLYETLGALSQVEEDIIKAGLERLSAYEETGLEPGEVETMRESKADAQFMLTELCRLCDYDRLEELAKADKEGRVLTPPCNVGQTVYFVLRDSPFFYPGTRGWYISENVITEVCTRGFCIDDIDDDDEPISFYPHSIIGVDVFLSRKDADADLERRMK